MQQRAETVRAELEDHLPPHVGGVFVDLLDGYDEVVLTSVPATADGPRTAIHVPAETWDRVWRLRVRADDGSVLHEASSALGQTLRYAMRRPTDPQIA